MIQEQFNKVAQDVSERYTNYLEALRNAYNRTILTADLSPRQLGTFKKEIDSIQTRYLEQEVDHVTKVHDLLLDYIGQAIADDKMDVSVTQDHEWTDYLYQNTNFLYEAIKLQSSKDALYINNFLRVKVLEVLNLNDHQKAYSLVFNNRDLSFFYTDKIGRKINSQKYIRSLARDYMVTSYSDMLVGSAILNGIDEVGIENVDPNHRDHGKIISVTGENELNYFSVRNEIFHPNSNSIIRFI
jgi:hypothetical protein